MPRLTPLFRTWILGICLTICATGTYAAEVDRAEVLLGDTLIFSAPDGQIVIAIDALDQDDVDLPDVVFRFLPDNPLKMALEWRGFAQASYKTGGLLVVSLDDEQRFLFNIDEDRGYAGANLPGDVGNSFQNGRELVRSGFADAQPAGKGEKQQFSRKQAGFTDATLSEIQANTAGWPGAFLDPPPIDKIWGVCQSGGSGATSCGVTCPAIPGFGNAACQVTCQAGNEACCQCIGPQPTCQCTDAGNTCV